MKNSDPNHKRVYKLPVQKAEPAHKRNTLTTEQKLEILEFVKKYGNLWKLISTKIGVSRSTIKNWYYRYQKDQNISPKRGPHIKYTDEDIHRVCAELIADPELTIKELASKTSVSPSTAYRMVKDNNLLPKSKNHKNK